MIVKICVIILFNLILCTIFKYCDAVSTYIQMFEKQQVCYDCKNKNNCFAQRKLFPFVAQNGYEFIVLSYFATRKKCAISGRNNKNWIALMCIGFSLNMVVVWDYRLDIVNIFIYCIAVTMLFFLAIIDWNTQYIPLEMNGIIFLCGLIRLVADRSNWLEYILDFFLVSGFLYVVNKVATPVLRRKYEDDTIEDVIGDGDMKLMAATGLLLGWKLNFIALGLGCVIGSIIQIILMKVKGSDRQFALGPYLSLGVYITMICGEQLVSWYLNMIGIVPM